MKNKRDIKRICSLSLATIMIMGSMPVYANNFSNNLPGNVTRRLVESAAIGINDKDKSASTKSTAETLQEEIENAKKIENQGNKFPGAYKLLQSDINFAIKALKNNKNNEDKLNDALITFRAAVQAYKDSEYTSIDKLKEMIKARGETLQSIGEMEVTVLHYWDYGNGKPSMANGAIVKPIKVLKTDKGYYGLIAFKSLNLWGFKGFLGTLSLADGTGEFHNSDKPEGYNLLEPISEYHVVDGFNDPIIGQDKIMKGKNFPKEFIIPIKRDVNEFSVQVYVPVMGLFGTDTGTQQARINVDWSTYKNISDVEAKPSIPDFTDKAITVDKASFYKKDYDPDETDMDEVYDRSNDYWRQKVKYEEFVDSNQTVYEIYFGKQFLQGGKTPIYYTDEVSYELNGKEIKAEKVQDGEDVAFRFALPGKVMKEIPLKIHALPNKDNPEYAYRNVLLQIPVNKEEKQSIPKFTDKSKTVEDAAFYKMDHEDETDLEDKKDTSDDFWSHEVEYEYFIDKDVTVYKIGFGNQFKKSDGTYMHYTDDVTAIVGEKEYKAEMTQSGPDRLFRFVLPGKPMKEIPLKIHALPYAGQGMDYKNVLLQVRDTSVKPTPPTPENPNKVKDGVYNVKVDLKNYYENKASMGNQAIDTNATITVKDGKAKITISAHPIKFMGVFGGLTKLFTIKDGEKYDHTRKDNLIEASSSDKKTFTSDKGDKKDYFTKFTFEVPVEAIKEKKEVGVVVWVDAMDSLAGGKPGAGQQPATLRIYGGNTEMEKFPEDNNEGTDIPNMPKVNPASPVDPLDNPRSINGMAEHYHEAGAPSMANTTLDHNILVQKVNDKTRYQVTFNEFVDKEFGINEPMESVSRLWYKDNDGNVKEAYLAEKNGNKRVFRFEIQGDVKNKIELTVLVVPMKKILGDGAAIQNAWLNLADKKIDGVTVDERYEYIPYDTLIEEDSTLPKGLVMETTPGVTGLKKVYRTYKTINGQNTGELTNIKAEVLKNSINRIIKVWNKSEYENNKKSYEERINSAQDGFIYRPAKLVLPDRKEVEFIANPYLGGYVGVKEENNKTTYKLHFAADSILNSMVQKLNIINNDKNIEVNTKKVNDDKSTDFEFTIEGKTLKEIPMEVSYRNDLKTPALLKIDSDNKVVFSRDVLKTDKINDIEFNVKKVNDPELEIGKTVVKQEGVKGAKYEITYCKTVDGKRLFKYANGTNMDKWPSIVIDKEEITKDPIDKIILVGTKEKENKNDKPNPDSTIKPEVNKPEVNKPQINNDGPNWDDYLVNNDSSSSHNDVFKTHTSSNNVVSKNDKKEENTKKPIIDKTSTKEFKDIESHWAKEVINYAVEKNYFKDIVTGDEFKPEAKLTRAEFVTILGRRAGIDPSKFTNTKFKDVDNSKYYQGFIAWAVENKIVNGMDDATFAPDKELSREEMAAFISRFNKVINLNLKKNNTNINFKDQDKISNWAKDSVKEMVELGVLKGMDNNEFSPKTELTRAQIAQVIYKIK